MFDRQWETVSLTSPGKSVTARQWETLSVLLKAGKVLMFDSYRHRQFYFMRKKVFMSDSDRHTQSQFREENVLLFDSERQSQSYFNRKKCLIVTDSERQSSAWKCATVTVREDMCQCNFAWKESSVCLTMRNIDLLQQEKVSRPKFNMFHECSMYFLLLCRLYISSLVCLLW